MKGFVCYLPRAVLQVVIILCNLLRRGNLFLWEQYPQKHTDRYQPSEEHCEVAHMEVLVQEYPFSKLKSSKRGFNQHTQIFFAIMFKKCDQDSWNGYFLSVYLFFVNAIHYASHCRRWRPGSEQYHLVLFPVCLFRWLEFVRFQLLVALLHPNLCFCCPTLLLTLAVI